MYKIIQAPVHYVLLFLMTGREGGLWEKDCKMKKRQKYIRAFS